MIPKVFDRFVWHKSRTENALYLTFDDGPVPGVTDFVLNELSKRNMKATFFMVGDNVIKQPELARTVFQSGHGVGNHTFHHVNGYWTSDRHYLEEVESCQKAIEDYLQFSTPLFRPPYGKISKSKADEVLKSHQIIMWDVLSGDYDLDQSPEKCLRKTKQYTQNGAIILFHDQNKTEAVVKKVLPDYLDYIADQGFKTDVL